MAIQGNVEEAQWRLFPVPPPVVAPSIAGGTPAGIVHADWLSDLAAAQGYVQGVLGGGVARTHFVELVQGHLLARLPVVLPPPGTHVREAPPYGAPPAHAVLKLRFSQAGVSDMAAARRSGCVLCHWGFTRPHASLLERMAAALVREWAVTDAGAAHAHDAGLDLPLPPAGDVLGDAIVVQPLLPLDLLLAMAAADAAPPLGGPDQGRRLRPSLTQRTTRLQARTLPHRGSRRLLSCPRSGMTRMTVSPRCRRPHYRRCSSRRALCRCLRGR